MSPLIIPLFMRSNITPDFTQLIFKSADGIEKQLHRYIYIYNNGWICSKLLGK